MVDKVADFTGAQLEQEKDGVLRNLANGLKSNAAGLADEAGKVHVPTLAEAYQEHRDQDAFRKAKADNVEALSDVQTVNPGLSSIWRVENQYSVIELRRKQID